MADLSHRNTASLHGSIQQQHVSDVVCKTKEDKEAITVELWKLWKSYINSFIHIGCACAQHSFLLRTSTSCLHSWFNRRNLASFSSSPYIRPVRSDKAVRNLRLHHWRPHARNTPLPLSCPLSPAFPVTLNEVGGPGLGVCWVYESDSVSYTWPMSYYINNTGLGVCWMYESDSVPIPDLSYYINNTGLGVYWVYESGSVSIPDLRHITSTIPARGCIGCKNQTQLLHLTHVIVHQQYW